MTRDLWSRKARWTMATVLVGAWGSLATVITLGPAAAADPCVPTTHPDAISTLTLDDTTLQGRQTVRLDFAGAIPDGSCAGDTVVLRAPTDFELLNGSHPLLDPDGETMGQMDVVDDVVTITFNDYVQTHDNVTFGGHFYGFLTGSSPETSYDLTWDLGGRTLSTPVVTNSCPDCAGPQTTGGKTASLTDDHEVHVYFRSAITSSAGEVVTFTDVLGAGQRMDCTRFTGAVGTRGVWGNLLLGAALPVDVVSCDDAGFTATMTSTDAGQYLSLQAYASTTQDRSTYPDTGTVTQDGRTDQVSATAREYSVGVEGTGDKKTAPESPEPSPTGTPLPTETVPTETVPTETVPTETVPTETVTPAVPVTTPPATTPPATTPPATTPPATTPPATTPPATTPPGTTPPGTTPPGTTPRLPDTGATASTPALAAAGLSLLAAGITLVCTARRRRVNPS